MDIYTATFENEEILKDWKGRKIIISLTYPDSFQEIGDMHAVNLALPLIITKEKAVEFYENGKINWDGVKNSIKDNDVFVCWGGVQMESFMEVARKKGIEIKKIPLPEPEIEFEAPDSTWETDRFRGLLGYSLPKAPITPPSKNGKPIPFLNHAGDIVIPTRCNPKYHYWKKGSLSLKEIVKMFIKMRPDLKDKLERSYGV